MKKLTKSMCWELVQVNKDRVNGVGVAFFRKPTTNECYEQRSKDDPPLCQESDDPNAAWYYIFSGDLMIILFFILEKCPKVLLLPSQ